MSGACGKHRAEIGMAEVHNIADLLEAGIRAEGLRQKAIANNIANLKTPGYRRFEVRFEELLAKALKDPTGGTLEEIEPQLYQPRKTPVNSIGNDVTMENEVGEMVKNNLRHETYVRLLRKKYSQIEAAMRTR